MCKETFPWGCVKRHFRGRMCKETFRGGMCKETFPGGGGGDDV